jgi:thymidylate synthase
LWNPDGNQRAALPSCLCMNQFYVDTMRNLLHLQIYIRSSDYFLANNWNTCTGAILVHLLCNLEGINLYPGELTVITGDTHIYKSHINQVKENLEREPFPYPKLIVKNRKNDITTFEFNDLELIGYKCHPNISASMAI